jgi:hypothetical protein
MFKILNIEDIQMKHLIYICSQCNYYTIIRYTLLWNVMTYWFIEINLLKGLIKRKESVTGKDWHGDKTWISLDR